MTGTGSKLFKVFLALVFALALTGFFIGTGQRPQAQKPPAPKEMPLDPDILPAPTYTEEASIKRGPNRNWDSDLSKIKRIIPTVPHKGHDDEKVKLALEERASRRAYQGAPPQVPHPIDQQNSANCIVCHGEGLKLSKMIAPRISHEAFSNCTQCHVELASKTPPSLKPGERDLSNVGGVRNQFVGLTERAGPRAWKGAPPGVPHPTGMRSNCLSCHGPLGKMAIQTPHPYRLSCLQCHPKSNLLDQFADDSLPVFPLLEKQVGAIGGGAHER